MAGMVEVDVVLAAHAFHQPELRLRQPASLSSHSPRREIRDDGVADRCTAVIQRGKLQRFARSKKYCRSGHDDLRAPRPNAAHLLSFQQWSCGKLHEQLPYLTG